MSLPPPDCAISTDVACTVFFDIAELVLQSMYAAVKPCIPSGCDDLKTYVTLGRGDDGIVDCLTVALSSISAISPAQDRQPIVHRVIYDVRLREKGWPVVRVVGDQIVMPPPDEQNRLALHVYAHLEAMYRRLSYMVAKREIAPPSVRLLRANLSSMTPLDPQGGVVGGYMTLQVEIG